MLTKRIATAGALLVATAAFAHGGAEHVKGTVKSVAEEAIVISTERGARSFRVTRQTSVVKDGAACAVGELHAGDRVVVHAAKVAPQEAERIVASGGKSRHGAP
jgi:hypothetical protein